MRQIQFCAWLLLIPLAATACSGDAFTAGDSKGTNETPAETSGGTAGRNHAGSGGNALQTGNAGKAPSAGSASGGASGGSTAAGGMSTAGTSPTGTGNVGGAYDEDCPSGAITFRMLPSPDLEKNYLCDAGCGTGWLTITDAEGATAFSIFSACGTASCESCQMLACAAAACLPTPLTAEGSDLVWTGTYLAKDTCGANMACQRQACVKPGKYKAKACAAINGGSSSGNAGACTPKNEQLCAEAEFEFPATATVKMLLKK